jgi:guanyl-specific ribonuclease Sa
VKRWLGHTAAALAGLLLASATLAFEPPPIRVNQLPAEAHHTLRLIDSGGPYPHKRDGITFHNRERLLPPKPKGWYREYTVRTPGERTRGARRIVTGGDPPQQYYYTADHYQSFQRILR